MNNVCMNHKLRLRTHCLNFSLHLIYSIKGKKYNLILEKRFPYAMVMTGDFLKHPFHPKVNPLNTKQSNYFQHVEM